MPCSFKVEITAQCIVAVGLRDHTMNHPALLAPGEGNLPSVGGFPCDQNNVVYIEGWKHTSRGHSEAKRLSMGKGFSNERDFRGRIEVWEHALL